MDIFDDTESLFAQLADVPGTQGVKTLIENHDAWQHNDVVQTSLNATLTARLSTLPKDPLRDARIHNQRRRLQSLVTTLKVRIASAG